MPRISDALERESRTVDLEQGDFERLLARRERKQRNRRIRAGAVGVIVALATAAVLARTLQSELVPAHPTPPPPAAAGTLAYIRNGDVYVADPDGSHAVRIANGLPDEGCDGGTGESYSAEGSMWSPDGRYLAYRSWDCSHPKSGAGVVISDAEGNVVGRFPLGGWQIAWSPDSTRIAVWDTFSYGETVATIGVYDVDGTRQTELMMPPGWTPSGDHDPAWMPDGTGVWVENVDLPLDGGPPRYLPAHGDPYATYSPDGSLIAYNNGSLMVARADGSDARVVLEGGSSGSDWGHPWSAAGDRIAVTTRARGSDWVGVVDVTTGSVTLLVEGEPGATLQAIGFSPSGDRVLYSSRRGDASRTFESSLWSVGIDGSDAHRVVDGTMDGEWLSP